MYEVAGHVLRKPEPSDVEALYEIKNDPAVAALLGGHSNGYAREDLRRWVEFHRERADEVLYVIVDPARGRVVGHVGLYKIDSRIGQAEFAILLGPVAGWGKGLGKAITRFMVGLAFDHLNLRRVTLQVLSTNERASRLYRSLGFVEEGRLREAQVRNGEYVDVVMMAVLRREWTRDAT